MAIREIKNTNPRCRWLSSGVSVVVRVRAVVMDLVTKW